VVVSRAALIDFYYDEASEKGREADEMEEKVDACAGAFLIRRVCWLQDEGGLGSK
jgi:hypothetical protein